MQSPFAPAWDGSFSCIRIHCYLSHPIFQKKSQDFFKLMRAVDDKHVGAVVVRTNLFQNVPIVQFHN